MTITTGAILLLLVLSGVLVLIWKCLNALYARHEKRLQLKSETVQGALEEVFPGCSYDPRRCLDREFISGTRLINDWNELSGNDYVSGAYKGHSIEMSDIHLVKHERTRQRNSKGHWVEKETRVTRFSGQWVACKLDKPLPGMLRLRENVEHHGAMKMLFGERRRTKDDVETENVAFNSQFQILTGDPHTAFYVLTPHFMEYIVSADRKAGGRTCLCFSGQWVHIAVHNNRDAFELKWGNKDAKDIPAYKARIRQEIDYITGILDELFRNEKLFSKEGT
ncbi:MAG: DUF3137 domain-containing protein [Clostridiales Family XIII bacterium]|jgi:hypothetical protein|nr:DUF3137 domain-containing protein [Clostridiales Family XIII bacterium]